MRVIHAASLQDFRWDVSSPVLAMGTMDGVHLAHQEILGHARQRAAAIGGTSGALTFARHPLEVLRPGQAPPLLTPLPIKLALLEHLGLAATVAVHFSPALAHMEAEDFVRQALVEGLKVAGLCIGYDFGFGKDRKGDANLLQKLATRYGFWLDVVPPIRLDGLVVSSRMIRGLLGDGKVEEAQRFLGRPYCLTGEVQPGAGRGQTLGFATANLPLVEATPLADGVYVGRLQVRGTFQDALLNLGRAPTFGSGEHRLEVHMPGWQQPLYGERVAAFFLTRLRSEQRFTSAEALVAQLHRDRGDAQAVWDAARRLPWPEWTLHS